MGCGRMVGENHRAVGVTLRTEDGNRRVAVVIHMVGESRRVVEGRGYREDDYRSRRVGRNREVDRTVLEEDLEEDNKTSSLQTDIKLSRVL